MDELNKDMLLGSAIQLIKDVERITFLGERMECIKANHGRNKTTTEEIIGF